mmetsp:Transcript_932/g.3044  ORF Transcript_932/g.3044 Transcript_932/m.3044 type:complete len:233 (-) Transcript_932:439-1137(-)
MAPVAAAASAGAPAARPLACCSIVSRRCRRFRLAILDTLWRILSRFLRARSFIKCSLFRRSASSVFWWALALRKTAVWSLRFSCCSLLASSLSRRERLRMSDSSLFFVSITVLNRAAESFCFRTISAFDFFNVPMLCWSCCTLAESCLTSFTACSLRRCSAWSCLNLPSTCLSLSLSWTSRSVLLALFRPPPFCCCCMALAFSSSMAVSVCFSCSSEPRSLRSWSFSWINAW